MHEDRPIRDADGRAKLHADIAHPINSPCREMIQERVIREFHQEQEGEAAGLLSRYDDFDYDEPPRPHSRPAGRGQTPHHRSGGAHRRGRPLEMGRRVGRIIGRRSMLRCRGVPAVRRIRPRHRRRRTIASRSRTRLGRGSFEGVL